MKKYILYGVLGAIGSLILAFGVYQYVSSTLPNIATLQDYDPLLVTQVFDRNNAKIGEFFRERRSLLPYDSMPKNVVNAFLAAEDDQFFDHGGINYFAILRAFIANMRAGYTVQGGSTITQQVAKTFFLTSEKHLFRKLREALLAVRLEEALSKEDILYLYLNQIFFGQGAYGIANAAETYFRKPVAQLSLAEIAILAGLPKAPSAYSPVRNPTRAKERQVYVLNRMADLKYITREEADKNIQEPVKVYLREKFEDYAPFFLETVRQMLISQIGETAVLDKGIKVYTSLDLPKQQAAQISVEAGLKELDKRQGYRGASQNTTDPKEVGEFLMKTRNKLISEMIPERTILPTGQFVDYGPLNLAFDIKKGLPFYLPVGKITEAIVAKVDDALGIVYVRVAEIEGAIDIDTMQWARKPNAEKRFNLDTIKKPSQALKVGDIIQVKIAGPKFSSQRLQKMAATSKETPKFEVPDFSKYAAVELDQEPVAESALLSFDQQTSEVVALVGGYDFAKSKFNRALQAARQTGSAFKAVVYASALDKGYNPATPVMDAPLVFEEEGKMTDEGQEEDTKIWKPANHSKSFGGDILFRNALIQSLNVPTVKIIEDLKVDWPADYSRRLGVFSQLNMDFTLALGSSSVTLYEMTKMFAQFGRLGKRLRPIIIKKVEDSRGNILAENITLDQRFKKEIEPFDTEFEERRLNYFEHQKLSAAGQEGKPPETPPAPVATNSSAPGDTPAPVALKKLKPTDANFFFEDPDQLIKPTTAYLTTSLLKGVVEDKKGTGARARILGREVAGKTGTTSGYYDAWFIGYTAQISTGVWVGFDHEKTLGIGEVGGRAAMPAWLEYMKTVHENVPQMTFPVPEGIVFANIDSDTGRLASASSKSVVRQAFLEGTEPSSAKSSKEEDTDFYKEDLSD